MLIHPIVSDSSDSIQLEFQEIRGRDPWESKGESHMIRTIYDYCYQIGFQGLVRPISAPDTVDCDCL